jgi:hypothetical protein
MCVGTVNSGIISQDVARFAGEQDQKVLIAIMLRNRSARSIFTRLHMSGQRLRQIQETGIMSERIAARFNQIEGVEIFRANHPGRISEKEQCRKFNEEHPFNFKSRQFLLFADYFLEWANRDEELQNRD